jgi:hypothetical protein
MRKRTEDFVVRTRELPWVPIGKGAFIRVLRTDLDTGHFSIILRVEKGCTFQAHRHLGAGEFFILKGEAAYSDKVAKTGDYAYEGNYAIHQATTVHEDLEALYIGYGPLVMLDRDCNPTTTFLDSSTIAALAESGLKELHATA